MPSKNLLNHALEPLWPETFVQIPDSTLLEGAVSGETASVFYTEGHLRVR